ncbi:MAG: TetR/AcrR family transcriptional regulator [Chloroflexota bacterium]
MTKHQPVDQRRNQILEAALMMFTQKGVASTSMSDIVNASGLSKGGVYWHFKSKSDIIVGALERFMQRDLGALEAIAFKSQMGPIQKLKAVSAQLGSEIEALRSALPLLIEVYAMAGRNDAIKASLQRYYAAFQDLLANILEDGVEEGLFAVEDTQFAAWQLITHAEGHFLLWMLNPQAALKDQLVESVDLFVYGLKK